MKSLRLLVLVLLAVLLPVRGAVAGAMWCASHGAAHGATPHTMAHVPGGMSHDHAAMHGGDHVDMHADMHADSHDGDRPAHGKAAATCQFCASGCCMASIVPSVPAIDPAPLTAVAEFPSLIVPAPAFESGGPERPPRAC